MNLQNVTSLGQFATTTVLVSLDYPYGKGKFVSVHTVHIINTSEVSSIHSCPQC